MAELSPPLVPYHQLLHHDLGLIEERHANYLGVTLERQSVGVTSKRRRECTKAEAKGAVGGGGGGGSEKKECRIRHDSDDVADSPALASTSAKLGSRSNSGTLPQWVNFEKMTSIGQVLLDIAVLQRTPLRLDEVAVIKKYLVNPPMVLGEKHLRIRSRSCEPAQESPISAARRRNSKEKYQPPHVIAHAHTPTHTRTGLMWTVEADDGDGAIVGTRSIFGAKTRSEASSRAPYAAWDSRSLRRSRRPSPTRRRLPNPTLHHPISCLL
jgi:hypothetical protein